MYRVDRPTALLITLLVLGGCEESTGPRVYSRAELIARMQLPDTFPRAALSLSEEQVEVEYWNQLGSQVDSLSYELISETARECLGYNPNFGDPDDGDLAAIAAAFDLETPGDVRSNFGDIRAIYIAKTRYEMYRSITAKKKVGSPPPRPSEVAMQSPTWIPNSTERKLLRHNPHLVVGTSLAVVDASSRATIYAGRFLIDGTSRWAAAVTLE